MIATVRMTRLRPVRTLARAAVVLVFVGAVLCLATGVGAKKGSRYYNAADIVVPPGYAVRLVVKGLNEPSMVDFDAKGDMYVAESGMLSGQARILKVTRGGGYHVFAKGFCPPLTALRWHRGTLYVSHRGKVSIVDAYGNVKDIITGLPSYGDHQNNMIAFGGDNCMYMGQGTATNSGVVGVDNYVAGWLAQYPYFCDYPGQDVSLRGQNFVTANPLTEDPADQATTGAYVPFNTTTDRGQVVRGRVPCTGSILRANSDGSGLAVYAWGLRNPYGVAFSPDGKLFVTEHGMDERGSRPVAGDWDDLYEIIGGAWYGWPDYAGGEPVTDPRFKPSAGPQPQFLLTTHPTVSPPRPRAQFPPHSGAAGLDFSPSDAFGYRGDAFVALVGDFYPITVPEDVHQGYKVVRVDLRTCQVSDFAVNRAPGSASYSGCGGLERPTNVRFGPDCALYVTDFGQLNATPTGLCSVPSTGAVWKIYQRYPPAVPGPAAPVPAPTPAPAVPEKPVFPPVLIAGVWLVAALLALNILAALWGFVKKKPCKPKPCRPGAPGSGPR